MSHFAPNPSLDLVLERTIPVPPDRVWDAWTQPELLMKWFTPAPWRTVAVDIDLRPGGRCVTTMESPDGQRFPNAGCYLHVEPSRLLVFTSVLGEDFRPITPVESGIAFTARIEIEDAGDGGTRYRAIAIHANNEDRDHHAEMGFAEGWGAALDQLVALMAP